MVGKGVHHNGEGHQVTARCKHEEHQLSKFREHATVAAAQDLAGIRHAVDEGVSGPELSNDVAGVGGNDAHAHDEDDGTDCITG